MKLSDFNYHLPKKLIAQQPAKPRDHSKLMVLKNNSIEHKKFYQIINYLKKDDVLVLNETKVIPAKLTGQKTTGAKVEFIIQESNKNIAKGRIKATKPRPGNQLLFNNYKAEITKQEDDIFTVKFNHNIKKIMKDIGQLPTPPYIKKKLEKNSHYQTTYSKKKGSIAAPTAGLHFTSRLLKKIKQKGVKIAKVCLHIDFGTFLPVRDINKKTLHEEYFEIDQNNADIINNRKGRLFAVGTTSIRTLESSVKNNKVIPQKTTTNLFIKPGHQFKLNYTGLITNFHLPKSSLLMLVSAFSSRKRILKAYQQAIKNNYRFYSLGDAMLIFG